MKVSITKQVIGQKIEPINYFQFCDIVKHQEYKIFKVESFKTRVQITLTKECASFIYINLYEEINQ